MFCACAHPIHKGRPCKKSCNCQESRPVRSVTPPTLAYDPEPALWVCYCGTVAPFDPYVFPHRDCDGGRPLTTEEIAAREGAA